MTDIEAMCRAPVAVHIYTFHSLQAAVRDAVNESCTCGGRGPADNPCPACDVWHRLAEWGVVKP